MRGEVNGGRYDVGLWRLDGSQASEQNCHIVFPTGSIGGFKKLMALCLLIFVFIKNTFDVLVINIGGEAI